MYSLRSLGVISCLLLACGLLLPAARASEWNENELTELSFSQAVEIPQRVLPAGTYWFVVLNDDANRDVVRIFSKDWSTIYATLLTTPTLRPQSTARTEVEFAEGPRNSPHALLKWYYPGELTGHEFQYPKTVEKELRSAAKQDILTQPLSITSVAAPGA